MTQNITDVDAFTDPVIAPVDATDANAASLVAMIQTVANRTRYLYNRIGTVPTLAASAVLGRASSGITEGKPATDYSFSLLALSSSVAYGDAIGAKGANVASATTTNIAAATGTYVNVTGTTTITGFGTAAAGARRLVQFTAALTLTHNATSLILPTAANITTAAGDVAEVVSEGSGNWRVGFYQRADGSPLVGAAHQEIDTVDDNVFFGELAGNVGTHSGQSNTGHGESALASLTTGDDNAAFGSGALAAATTASDATAIGSGALAAFDGGGATAVAVGYNAASLVTSGDGITAVGGAALGALTTGAAITAIGSGAFASLTAAGTGNTAVGYSAASANATGTGNTALGTQSFGDVTGAPVDNTIIGSAAMRGVTAVSLLRNTAIGAWAGWAAGTGADDNTLAGYYACRYMTSGADNVAIGSGVGGGVSGTRLETGDGNILLGKGATVPATSTSDHLNIGDTVFADMANNRVRIGGSGALSALDGLQVDEKYIAFLSGVAAPVIQQEDDTANSVTGDALTLQAQNCTGTTTTGGNLVLQAGTGTAADGRVLVGDVGGSEVIATNDTGLGFFATTPIAKPAVTGSAASNAALASLLTALENYGLITDSST